jgi:hypothetical protein
MWLETFPLPCQLRGIFNPVWLNCVSSGTIGLETARLGCFVDFKADVGPLGGDTDGVDDYALDALCEARLERAEVCYLAVRVGWGWQLRRDVGRCNR